MERTFQVLKVHTTSIKKCLPPSKFKDIRDWSASIEEFKAWVKEHATASDPNKIVPTTQPTFLVDKFLSTCYMAGEQRLLHNVHQDFYKWTGGCDEKLEQIELEGELYDYFDTIEVKKVDKKGTEFAEPLKVNKNFIDNILRRLKSRCYVKVSEKICEPFFIDGKKPTNAERIIPFNNGLYLDVETDEVKVISPNLFITSTLQCPYDPNAQCPLWEGTINTNFNGNQECIDLLAEFFGYCLIPTNFLQSMMLFTGKPRSGKSTTKNILERLLGEAKFFAAEPHNFTNRFGTSDLKDRHLATISEQEAIGKYNADRMFQKLKTITGADSIRIEEKFKDAYNVKLFSRFLLVLNNLPKFDDAAGALPPRLNLLWFDNNYEKSGQIDRHLENKLVTELPGIALWAIKGLKRLLKSEKFTRPEESEKHLRQLENLNNPLLSMINECCDVYKGPNKQNHYIPTDKLFEFHKTWYDYCNEKKLSREEFGRRLKATFPHIENMQKRIGGDVTRTYIGLEFKPSKLKEYEMNKIK